VRPVPAATGALLWIRAAVVSTFALGVGAVAHVQAGGLLPGPGALLAMVLGATLASAPLLRRQGSTVRIVALLVAGQSAVHVALSATAGHRGDPLTPRVAPVAPPAGTGGGRRGSYFDVAYASNVREHAGSLSVPAPLLHAITDATEHPLMALAHLLAAAACGWWLARGERALWRLLELSARGWASLAGPALNGWSVAARAVACSALQVELPVLAVLAEMTPPQQPIVARSASRRGPPRPA
jgi:hypothetical protein